MNKIKIALALALTFAMSAFGLGFAGVEAKAQTQRKTKRHMKKMHLKNVVKRVEQRTDAFQKSLDAALDRSRLNGTDREDEINALVDELEFATDRLRRRADDDMANAFDVKEVLSRAVRVDRFMRANSLTPQAQYDWSGVRSQLDDLARMSNVAWVWTVSPEPKRADMADTRRVLERLEQRADAFSSSFDHALDVGRRDGTRFEDFANRVVDAFENALDRLETQSDNSDELNREDLKIVLNNALAIEDFMRKNQMTPRARRDWARVKANIDELAYIHNIAWVWTGPPVTTLTVVTVNPGAGDSQRAEGEPVGLTGENASPEISSLSREIRRELLSELPYYGVFDWIEFEVQPDRTVVLRGHVLTPPDTKSRAEAVVKDVEGVNRVVNEIETLPVSTNDDRLRRQLYRAIYDYDSPLFKYGVGSRQSIHIIVKNGHVKLEGVVDNEADKNLSYMKARNVSGSFSVENNLRVDKERRY